MNLNEVSKLTDQAIETWNSHDTQKFLKLVDDTIVVNELGLDQPHRGKEGAREFIDSWIGAFPDFKIKILNRVVAEDSIGVELEFTGTNTGTIRMGDAPEIPATNRKVTSKGSFFARVKNGKFTQINAYPDLVGMLTQLGVMHELQA